MADLTDAERVVILSRELARARLTWNYFVDPICHGLYPQRDHSRYSPATRFNGSDDERLFQIFKILDFEVRRIAEAARAAGIDLNQVGLDYSAVFDDLSRATGVTETSHSDG